MSQSFDDQMTVETFLLIDSSSGDPITLESNVDSWGKKAFNRYFLESNGGSDKGILSDSNGGSKAFLRKCKVMLSVPKYWLSEGEFETVKRWCVTYVTLGDSKFSGKTLKASTDTRWIDKESTAEGNESVKTILKEIKDQLKSRKKLHKWCTMAMDASESYELRDKVEELCFDTEVAI